MSQPPLELRWDGDERFVGRTGGVEVCLDGSGAAGPSPMQAVALGLGACLATDVVDILRKGRLDVRSAAASLGMQRAETPPRRFVSIALHLVLEGSLPTDRVERAVRLSRETYCSVWHSLRPDIVLHTTFEVRPTAPA